MGSHKKSKQILMYHSISDPTENDLSQKQTYTFFDTITHTNGPITINSSMEMTSAQTNSTKSSDLNKNYDLNSGASFQRATKLQNFPSQMKPLELPNFHSTNDVTKSPQGQILSTNSSSQSSIFTPPLAPDSYEFVFPPPLAGSSKSQLVNPIGIYKKPPLK